MLIKKRLFISSILLLLTSYHATAYVDYFKVRPYSGFGYTLGENINVGSGNLFNYRFGLQGIYQFTKYVGIGIDATYMHLLDAKYDAASNSSARINEGSVNFFTPLAILELNGGNNILIVQTGVGLSIATAGNFKQEFTYMLALGLDIPLTDSISLPIISRFDFIFPNQSMIPYSLNVGLTFRFGGSPTRRKRIDNRWKELN